MADDSMPRSPDYDLADELAVERPEQYRALFEDTRARIVTLLLDRAATTTELAEVLGKPKGTVGHHLKVLEDAGLVRVVRTERVRALEARYYGRTARVFWYDHVAEARGEAARTLTRAAQQAAGTDEVAAREAGMQPPFAYLRQARIPAERAHAWHDRLAALIDEFLAEPTEGDVTYALVVGLHPAPGLRPEPSEPSGPSGPVTEDPA
ncbi:ArsR family transcriptional regulator [Nocardioides zeae]|nr:ArsR family transcriptional regulator [Nocardioides zeae]